MKRRLDEVDMKLESANSRMENLKGTVEMVKDYLKELREMMMNKEFPGGDQGKGLM